MTGKLAHKPGSTIAVNRVQRVVERITLKNSIVFYRCNINAGMQHWYRGDLVEVIKSVGLGIVSNRSVRKRRVGYQRKPLVRCRNFC